MWREFKGKYDSLSEELKVRVCLVTSAQWFSDSDQIERKASQLMPKLLSGQMLNHHSSTFWSLIWNIPEGTDRKALTHAMIESLRKMDYRGTWELWRAISRIVKYLNLWYDLDIGGLGTDVRKHAPDLDKMDLEAVAAEAVTWYDTVYRGADPNAVR